jgi:hypothetical protein
MSETKTQTKKQEAEVKEHSNEGLNLRQRLMNFQLDEVEIHKSKAAYGYSYAPLDVILPLIKPYLKKHGIGFVHNTHLENATVMGVSSQYQFLTTTFYSMDDTKDQISCTTRINDQVQLAKMNEFMVMGSAITYFRRYHIVTILGLTTDEDTDAGGAQPQQTPPTSKTDHKKTPGRSVESAPVTEDTVDYAAIFDNITKNKTEKQSRDMFEMYKKKMSPEVLKKVTKIIDDKFKK